MDNAERQGQSLTLPDLPTEGYSLTYLMDGVPDCGVTYPVCLLSGGVMLTLDGRQLPWPTGETPVPSFGLETRGDYCYMAPWDAEQPPYVAIKGGLIDATGNWVVPMESGRGLTYAIEGGFFSEVYRDNHSVWQLLDEQGQVIQELDGGDGDPFTLYPPLPRQPFRGITPHQNDQTSYYVDADGVPVSQYFAWAGELTSNGQGFVGIDAKIYRIEFQ